MTVNFVHLHVHTGFSLLDGASRTTKLLQKAKELNMKAIAITDHGTMYGVIDFYRQAQNQGIKPIIGCEVYIAPQSRFDKTTIEGEAYYHLVLIAENQQGYRNLIQLVSKAHLEGFYYKPRIDKAVLRNHACGLIGLSGCIAGELPTLLLKGNYSEARQKAGEYIDIFGKDNFFLEIQDNGMPEQRKVNQLLLKLSRELDIGLVATNDVHYVNKEDAESHDILLCIQTGKTVDDSNRIKFPTNEFYLKSGAEMSALFPGFPEAIANSVRIAERCNLTIDFSQLHLPDFPVPDGISADQYLRNLCYDKLNFRYRPVTDQARTRLEYELDIIGKMGYASYFLIVWDFVNYARTNSIPVGPGRGSAAGSIVSYLLGITNIDPLKYGLLFERFLNPERITMPDIDIDFCYERRGKIIEYVVARYGSEKVAQIITFGTMAAKAAVRDVGRALNMSYGEVDRIAKLVPNELGITLRRALEINSELRKAYQSEPEVRKLIDLAMAVEGLPRHASTHAAGLVISKEPLTHYVPLQNSSEGLMTTQYDKDHVEEIGLLKMDLLGLRTLTVIGDTLTLIKKNFNLILDIDNIPLDDAKTCAMLSEGDTAGVFQMESGGMTNLVKELKPERFDDLIPLVALYRPGPLGSGMVTDFIEGRHGKKTVSYLHPLLEPILCDTFGVMLYQEQVMQVASVMAGFTLGQADLLRRAMGKKKPEVLAGQRSAFVEGALARGIAVELAEEIFDLMAHFADYGFNKSHSAAYALVAYQTAYLKAHYPREFMAALLTSVMGSNDKVSFYIEECKRMNIAVLPPTVNASMAGFSVDGGAIRFGLAGVKNVGENAIGNIISAREQGGPFSSLVDFCARVDMRVVNKRVIESLIKCGAFDYLGFKRAQLLEVMDKAIEIAATRQRDKANGQIGLFGEESLQSADELIIPPIDELPQEQILALEKEIIGFYVTGHPLDKYRAKLKNMTSIEHILNGGCFDGKNVRIAGLIVSAKRITTKSGGLMCFLLVEDFTRQIEVVVFPKLFERVSRLLFPDAVIVVSGRVSVHDDGGKIIAEDIVSFEAESSEVRLRITKAHETGDVFVALKELLTKFNGKAVVYMHLVDSCRVIKTEPEYWIDPRPEAIGELERLLGKENIVVS